MSSFKVSFSAALLATTALAPFGAAYAQEEPDAATDTVVVRGQYIPDEKRETSEISSIIDAQDFQAQGDADIASALTRLTGITLAQDKFVYVRGMNERYSNATLNGSPLPSPEPLRRVAPLDMFPTGLLRSAGVQKTFSPQYSAEFGGGLIDMRTSSLPADNFFEISLSSSVNTRTTADRGLTYYGGGDSDYTGFDDGTRNLPEPLAAIFDTTRVGNSIPEAQQQEIGRSLVNSPLWVVQGFKNVEPGFGASANGGVRWDVNPDLSIGVVGALGYSSDWFTKVGHVGAGRIGADGLETRYLAERMGTTHTIDTNALLSVGFDILANHQLTFTGLAVRSTDKEARIEEAIQGGSVSGGLIDYDRKDNLEWIERQVWMTQATGEHVFPDAGDLEVEWRASYAEAFRDAPYQRQVLYELDPSPFTGEQTYRYGGDLSDNQTQFSKIEDNSQDYGIDLTLPVQFGERYVEFKLGGASYEKNRDAYVRQFAFEPGSVGIPSDLLFSRIDYIFADPNINSERLRLVETGGIAFPEAYTANMKVDALYAMVDAELTPFLRLSVGGRYEESTQWVDTFTKTTPIPDNGLIEAQLDNDWLLPAGTLTWTFADDLQLRLGYSQTITRPQFRELAFAEFINTETDQRFRGNPFLQNTEIDNYDARLEYYFGREQFVTLGAFYKELTNPIEEFVLQLGDSLATSFLNAPAAELYGLEFEFEKVLPVQEWLGLEGGMFDGKDIIFKTNYTYTDSSVSADGTVTLAQGTVGTVTPQTRDAAGFIVDGRPLQGTSEHIFNLQLGFEDEEARSRFNVLFNFASERSRAVEDLSNRLPEITEKPPMTVDLVYSKGFDLWGGEFEIGVNVENLFNEDYEAFQEDGDVKVPVDTYYLGQSASISLKRRF